MYVYMYVFMYVCTSVTMYVPMCVYAYICMYVCVKCFYHGISHTLIYTSNSHFAVCAALPPISY